MTPETPNSQAPATSPVATIAEPAPSSVPIGKSRRSANSVDTASRCHYRYPNGRRCTLPGLPAKSGLCLRHYNRQVAAGLPLVPSPNDSADLSADLLPHGPNFSSAEDLREYLTRLLILMTRGSVSPRRAAVLAYVTNQLLHSHRAIDKELEDEPQKIIFDIPRPNRD